MAWSFAAESFPDTPALSLTPPDPSVPALSFDYNFTNGGDSLGLFDTTTLGLGDLGTFDTSASSFAGLDLDLSCLDSTPDQLFVNMESSSDHLPSVDSLLGYADMLLFDTPSYQGEQRSPQVTLHTSPSLHTSSATNSPLSSLDGAMPAAIPFSHHHHSLSPSSESQPIAMSSSSKRKAAESSATADEEEEAKTNKRQRNTMAARKYRQKRLDLIADLEKALEDMTAERDALKLQLARKDAEAGALREMLAKK